VAGTIRADKMLGRAAYGSGRVSTQRLAIARVADEALDRAFSVDDLAASVRREVPGIGLATVYRAVAAMESAGFVESLGTRDGATLYARCSHDGHHHHMLCTGCGAVTEVGCPMDPHLAVRSAGFRITGHHLVIYGTCPACCDMAAAGGAADGPSPTA
jgi:Fur family transcriptional regulator, ferric uptake regulator